MTDTDTYRLIHITPDVAAAQAEARADFLYRIRAWSEGQLTLDRLTADKWWPATRRAA